MSSSTPGPAGLTAPRIQIRQEGAPTAGKAAQKQRDAPLTPARAYGGGENAEALAVPVPPPKPRRSRREREGGLVMSSAHSLPGQPAHTQRQSKEKERERREREEQARIARKEAAERSRMASREWKERQAVRAARRVEGRNLVVSKAEEDD